jgi:hypothetical protein
MHKAIALLDAVEKIPDGIGTNPETQRQIIANEVTSTTR